VNTHFRYNAHLPVCRSPQFHSCSSLESSLVSMGNYRIRVCLWAICMWPAGGIFWLLDREQGYFALL